MEPAARDLTIEELAEQAGVRVRTVRYYIAEGLLPGPGARGRAAAYGEEHRLRLQLIRRLAERHVPLAEMRARLAGLSLDAVRSLLAAEERQAKALERIAETAASEAYLRELLGRPALDAAAPASPDMVAPETMAPWSDAMAPQTATAEHETATSAPAPAADRLDGPRRGTVERGDAGAGEGAAALLWQRLVLAPGVELHVRADARERDRDLIRRIQRAVDPDRR